MRRIAAAFAVAALLRRLSGGTLVVFWLYFIIRGNAAF